MGNVCLLQPGDRLGEFEIVERIGRGGFATVYRARQRRIERDVAVKVIEVRDSAELTVRRFMREVDLVKRLEHPNIVRLYDFGTAADGRLWMATELIDGEELATVIAREGAMPASRAVDIMLQALSALTEAHEHDIVHRDIKPTNIMLVAKGAHRDVVKLLDFGIGRAIGHLEDAPVQEASGDVSGLFGTPRYMPPERIQSDPGGPSSDVYSMGLIFIEMLSGRPAVPGDLALQVLGKQLTGRLDIPPWLDSTSLSPVIRRATARQLHERYPSAREFFDALRAIPAAELERLDLGHSEELDVTSETIESDLVRRDDVQDIVEAEPITSPELLDSASLAAVEQVSAKRRRLPVLAAGLALVVVLVALVWWLRGGEPEELPASTAEAIVAPASRDASARPVATAVARRLTGAASGAVAASLAVVPPSREHVEAPSEPATWTVRSTPTGAMLLDGTRVVCSATPCDVIPRAGRGIVELEVRLAGHYHQRIAVDAREDADVQVILEPVQRKSLDDVAPSSSGVGRVRGRVR